MAKGRILAVDDQRYFRELIEGLLTEEGYEVQTASSGEEALRILDRSSFDVIVTDLVMPVMTGTELVQHVKERDPDQDIVVVTGVVDVKSAVDAMKVGATEYLLKPFDRQALATALAGILQRGRLRSERDRLLEENIEYLGERSLFERALGLFSQLGVDALSQKLLEALCHETGAQGGVFWLANDEDGHFHLSVGRGLVRLEEERETLTLADLPARLRDGAATSILRDWDDGSGLPRPALVVGLRRAGSLVGLLRLTDKLGGDEFDELDRNCAEKLVQFASIAYANAERFHALERRTLQDPDTGAYRVEYLSGIARNEIEKANRFGRTFSLLEISFGPLEPVREAVGDARFETWRRQLTHFVGRLLRATDLLAEVDKGVVRVLLAESDAIGAATFKQRTRRALEQSEPIAGVAPELRPGIHIGCATYPGDATQLESLERVLAERVQADRRTHVREQQLDGLPLSEALQQLLGQGELEPVETAASLVRFALTEVGRRPRERNLFFLHPGRQFQRVLGEGLDLRRDPCGDAELVVAADPVGRPNDDVTWVAPARLAGCPPFAVHFGDGPPYALVCAEKPEGDELRLHHTSERALVEYLAFRLQRELRVPRLQ